MKITRFGIFALMLLSYMVSGLRLNSHDMGRKVLHTCDWGHYNSASSPNYRNNQKQNSWLSWIYDGTPVTQLSIPGTHDSSTYGCRWDQFCDITKCQSWNLEHQLQSGIRYFDLRVQFSSNW